MISPEKMEELIKFNAKWIALNIQYAEEIINDDGNSEYSRQCAKMAAYDRILDHIYGEPKK